MLELGCLCAGCLCCSKGGAKLLLLLPGLALIGNVLGLKALQTRHKLIAKGYLRTQLLRNALKHKVVHERRAALGAKQTSFK